MNLSPFVSKFIWSFVSSLSEKFLICFLFASIFMFDRFCCLIFLRSLRFLFAMRVFDLFPMAPCLWWESEKTHLYFSTYLFLVSPNFSIISLNWAILTRMFSAICSTLLIVTVVYSWRRACCFSRRFRRVRCFRDSRSLRLFYLDPVVIDLSLVETCECLEDFLFSVLTDYV